MKTPTAKPELNAVSDVIFNAKGQSLKVVAIADLITGEGFEAFSNLDDDRQEAILCTLLDQAGLVHESVCSAQTAIDSLRLSGGAQ